MFDISWNLITSIADTVFTVFGNLLSIVTTPINTLITTANIPQWLVTILSPLLNTNFGGLSLVQLMLQNGLVIFLAIVIIKFVVGIIT